MTLPESQQTPNERLAAAIVKNLIKSQLLDASQEDAALLSIGTGRATAREWCAWIEYSPSLRDKAKTHAQN